MISDKRTSGLLGQLGNIKNDEEFEKYISENTFNNYSDDKNNALTFSAYYNSILAEKKYSIKKCYKRKRSARLCLSDSKRNTQQSQQGKNHMSLHSRTHEYYRDKESS